MLQRPDSHSLAEQLRNLPYFSGLDDPTLDELAHSAAWRSITRDSAAPRPVRPQIKFSPRELEVLRLMATAATYKEIGGQLFISEETVRSHVKSILAKIDQPNRTQAVVAAVKMGLIKLE